MDKVIGGRSEARGRQMPRLVGLVSLASVLFWQPSFGKEGADRRPDVQVRGDARSEYTDNLFHYNDRQLDDFDAGNDPDRFEGIDDTSDLVTRVRLQSEFRWSLRRKRDFRLSLDGAYFWHLENDVADYGELSAGVRYDPSKRDRVDLEIDQTLDRFKKNYKLADSTDFEAASHDQTDVTVAYSRELRKKDRWSVEASYRARRRRFGDPFSSRDLDGDYVRLSTSYRLPRKIRAETSVEVGDVKSGTGVDGGILIDRSYDQFRLDQGFTFKLGGDVELSVDVGYRRREATTDQADDLGRFDRVDDRLRLRVGAEREWKNGVIFRAESALIDNDSDRLDPTVETDEDGYDELTVGFGVAYRF